MVFSQAGDHFFAGTILPVDAQVADRWGRIGAAAGRPLPAIERPLGQPQCSMA